MVCQLADFLAKGTLRGFLALLWAPTPPYVTDLSERGADV